MLPGLAGCSACNGETSSVTASVNAAKIPTTAIGARRRATSDTSVSHIATSSAHASPSGCAGHHDQPTSVTAVSSTTKNSATTTSTRTGWRRNPQRTPLMGQWYDPPLRPAAKTQPSSGAEPTKVAWPQEHPSLRRWWRQPSALPPRGPPAVEWPHASESTRGRDAMTTASISDDALQLPAVGQDGIDPRASTITFKSRHLFGLAPVHGTMAIRDGLVDIADPLTGSSVQAEIDTTSFDTGSRQRDRDVRSPRFLDAERYPSMTFASRSLDRSNGRWTLTGTLTACGVARPVSLTSERSTVT